MSENSAYQTGKGEPDGDPDGDPTAPDHRLLELIVEGVPLLIDESRVEARESGERVQRNPTGKPPFGWLLGLSEELEVWQLSMQSAGNAIVPSAGGEVLVIEQGEGTRRGLLVDAVGDTITLPAEAVHSLDSGLGCRPFSGVVESAEGPRLVLDAERLWSPLDPTGEPAESDLELPDRSGIDPGARQRVVLIPVAGTQSAVGLSAQQIAEIRPSVEAAPLPPSSGAVIGVGRFGDRWLPVADVGRIIDPISPPMAAKRMLVAYASRSGRRIVLTIPADIRLVDLPIDNRPRRNPDRQAAWIRGVFEVEEGFLVVPDLDSLVA